MKIDAILKPKKASRPRKRKNEDDVLDRAADEEVSRLRESMLMTAAEDEQANKEKMPATAKLRLLPSVLETLRKCVCLPLPWRVLTVPQIRAVPVHRRQQPA